MKFKLNSLVVVLGLAACSLSAQAQQTVKIGFLGTLSGPAGALGQDQYDAFMLGVEHNGGKLGGATVQVIKEDDQLKTDLGVQLAQKLIERDKVNIITGVTFSNVMMAIHKPITDAGVLLVGSNAGPSPLTGKGCSPRAVAVAAHLYRYSRRTYAPRVAGIPREVDCSNGGTVTARLFPR